MPREPIKLDRFGKAPAVQLEELREQYVAAELDADEEEMEVLQDQIESLMEQWPNLR